MAGRDDPLFTIGLTVINRRLYRTIKNQCRTCKIKLPVTEVSIAFCLIPFEKHDI